ncbi:MAG: anti-sigma F factor [Clostridia bacterium]
MKNKFSMRLMATLNNEAFARSTVSAFCLPLNPTIEEIADIKTAVSEAITNCIVHAYEKDASNYIDIEVGLDDKKVSIIIQDNGCGIENVEQAIQPFFTTKPEQERSGMGFTLMNTFMDKVEVSSQRGKGTRVLMEKTIKKEE